MEPTDYSTFAGGGLGLACAALGTEDTGDDQNNRRTGLHRTADQPPSLRPKAARGAESSHRMTAWRSTPLARDSVASTEYVFGLVMRNTDGRTLVEPRPPTSFILITLQHYLYPRCRISPELLRIRRAI
jgi:hypothetical protein